MPGGAGRSARTEVEADLHAATHGGGARGGLARDDDLLVAGGRRAEGTGRPWRCAANLRLEPAEWRKSMGAVGGLGLLGFGAGSGRLSWAGLKTLGLVCLNG